MIFQLDRCNTEYPTTREGVHEFTGDQVGSFTKLVDVPTGKHPSDFDLLLDAQAWNEYSTACEKWRKSELGWEDVPVLKFTGTLKTIDLDIIGDRRQHDYVIVPLRMATA